MRIRSRRAAIALACGVLCFTAVPAAVAGTAPRPAALPGLTRLPSGAAWTRGVVELPAVPTPTVVSRLRGLGLRVQPMQHLPLAIVEGPGSVLHSLVGLGIASDVYPDDRLEYLDTASSDAMGGAAARMRGFTGKGVTVAVVDSGCDGTHPDLADHIAHNVSLVGAEYLNMPPDPHKKGDGAIVVPIDQGPYNDTDLGSGHGTHVAGIIAADGHTGKEHIGVAPDATLVCYSIGQVIFTTAVVSAYDHMLDQPDLWGIDVVNNSWGNSFQLYDPNNPVNVATKAVTDRKAIVVFAAGNSGADEAEMSLNPFSQAPWVVSVAAESLEHERGDFSSNGLPFDNSYGMAPPADGHERFTGQRVGLYHPDVTAPGVDISSTCDTTGTVVGPCPPGNNTTASGTSMASPHVAGAMAVLRQQRPTISAAQALAALQLSATPVKDDAPFWQVGYGSVDLGAAVKLLATTPKLADLLPAMDAKAKAQAASGPWAVASTDLWNHASPPLTVGGTDSAAYTISVPKGTGAVRATITYPSASTVGLNGFEYDLTVKDASGKVVGTSTANFSYGVSTVMVDIAHAPAGSSFAYGTWTVEASGLVAASDPDTLDSESALGRFVVTQVAVLKAR